MLTESILRSKSPKIAHVVVFGTGRPQNGLLISPNASYSNPTAFLGDIWPSIEEMNKVTPAHSRVVRELVIIEDPELPFILTDKGTVREKLTIESYAVMIDQAYKQTFTAQGGEVPLPDEVNQESIAKFLEMTLKVYLPDITINEGDDLFEYGSLILSHFMKLI